MQRVPIPELLDSDAGTPQEVESALRDLYLINRWFGGVAGTTSMLQDVARRARLERLSVLEVACGRGDLPRMARERLQQRGIELDISLLDRQLSHLPRDNNGQQSSNGYHYSVVGDALTLPFSESAFDVVSCNLFVHHLSPDQLLTFVDEALRVSRYAVVINDLRRSWIHLALVYLSLPLYASRLTHSDAPASVRQAYQLDEIVGLLKASQSRSLELRRYHIYRMGVIAWKI
jgi:ubiquinone/menaquinone biosynthesis C-methylase UbiE